MIRIVQPNIYGQNEVPRELKICVQRYRLCTTAQDTTAQDHPIRSSKDFLL